MDSIQLCVPPKSSIWSSLSISSSLDLDFSAKFSTDDKQSPTPDNVHYRAFKVDRPPPCSTTERTALLPVGIPDLQMKVNFFFIQSFLNDHLIEQFFFSISRGTVNGSAINLADFTLFLIFLLNNGKIFKEK
jgi:hypothetical protein